RIQVKKRNSCQGARARAALAVNITTAQGLQDALRTILGPNDTTKMLLSGDVKLTNDGNVLLHKMQIPHPTASLTPKVARAQDDVSGDCTTSSVLIIGELIKRGDLYVSEGLHLRTTTDGFESAKVKVPQGTGQHLTGVLARTSLYTKAHAEHADVPPEAAMASILAVTDVKHKSEMNTSFIRSLVLDQRAWQPDVKKKSRRFIHPHMCNVPHEYEKKKEVNSGFFKTRIQKREKLVKAERRFIEDTIKNMTELKKKVCGVSEKRSTLEEEKFTLSGKCNNLRSVTLLVKGPNKHILTQIKDATGDGLRAVKNALADVWGVLGAGAVEKMGKALILSPVKGQGRAQLGVQAFANALLIIPIVLAQSSGFDFPEALIKIKARAEHSEPGHLVVGVDLNTGEKSLPLLQCLLEFFLLYVVH
uniref:Uncharacterized protein n=1 Tax=Ailuropoda melanoleuca TaxID=9646 RepID=G1LMQ5_AILME